MHELGPGLRELTIYLAAAGLVVPIFSRLRISPIIGFILAGALIGPFGLIQLQGVIPWLRYAAITDLNAVKPFAHMGIAFLLFMIGLELSTERLWPLRKLVFGLGFLQVAVTAAAIGFIAWLLGNSPPASIVLGCSLALSSTAIVMQLLGEQDRTLSDVARASFAVLLFQDLAVVPILFLVDAFS